MYLNDIQRMPGITQEELSQLQKDIRAMAEKQYTWEEKINSLVALAKAAGTYINAYPGEPGGDDYLKDAWKRLKDAYEEFCQWRHEEPYLVDELFALVQYGMREGVMNAFRVTPEMIGTTSDLNRTPSVSAYIICKTCGGTASHHRPSILDPSGTDHPDHRVSPKYE